MLRLAHPGLHKHGLSNDKLCKRYFFMLDTIVKARVGKKKADAPPKMLYLRELSGAVPPVLYKQLEILVRLPCLAHRAAHQLLHYCLLARVLT